MLKLKDFNQNGTLISNQHMRSYFGGTSIGTSREDNPYNTPGNPVQYYDRVDYATTYDEGHSYSDKVGGDCMLLTEYRP